MPTACAAVAAAYARGTRVTRAALGGELRVAADRQPEPGERVVRER